MSEPLSNLAAQILAIEAQQWRYEAGKERAIIGLGLRPVRYYQLLNRIIDDPAALAHDPLTVNRLRRWREQHRAQAVEPIR